MEERGWGTWTPGACPSAPRWSSSGTSLRESGCPDTPCSLGQGPSPGSSRGSQNSEGRAGYWGRGSRRPWGPGGRKAGRARSRGPRGGRCPALVPLVHPAPDEETDGSASQPLHCCAACRDPGPGTSLPTRRRPNLGLGPLASHPLTRPAAQGCPLAPPPPPASTAEALPAPARPPPLPFGTRAPRPYPSPLGRPQPREQGGAAGSS